MRLVDRMELPSTSAERTASFLSVDSVYISAPQFPLDGRLRQADNRGCEAMIPACRVVVSGPLEIRVSIGSCYLCFSLVEAASSLLSSSSLSATKRYWFPAGLRFTSQKPRS